MAAALLLALALQAASAPPAGVEQMDFVCAATDNTGAKSELRYSVDLHANAWCAREPECKEIKTVFGMKGSKIVLESSQLEVTSYETSIDRATGAYSSMVSLSDPPLRTESTGVCKPVAFTPFGVSVSGKALKP